MPKRKKALGRTPQGGRQPKLMEPGVRENLVSALELGVPIYLACQGVGISDQAFRNWMQRGAGEHEARGEEDYEPDEFEQPYVDLYLEVVQARVKAATRNVAAIQKAAQGGAVTEKTTRKYRDSEGNLVEEETVRRSAPDWRAAAWYLERSHRSEYGKDAVQVEMTGAGGGALQVEVSDTAALAARLSEHLAAGVATLPELTGPSGDEDDEDIHDAELVDDD